MTDNNGVACLQIEARSGKGNKLHIHIDGEYAATVDADYWYGRGLGGCQTMSESDAAELLTDIEARRAYNKALYIIEVRDHCAGELYNKLRRSFPDEAAAAAVEKLCGMGLIDDESYARRLARELNERKGFSPMRIKRELIFRGIDRELADEASQELDVDERGQISELLRTKFAASLNDEKGIKRTFNSLLRLGYSPYDIRAAMRDIADESDEEY